MRFIIAATPGSGTRYIAQVFKEVGVDCGHEQMFKHSWDDGRLRITKGANQGESSWYAGAFLHYLDMPIVHQTRHPLLVIRTLVGMEHWRNNKFTQPIFDQFTPNVRDYQDSPVLWAARFWLDWNRIIERWAGYRWDVATVSAEDIWPVLRNADIITVKHEHLRFALGKVPKTGGDRRYGYALHFGDLGPMAQEVKERALAYGYEV